MQILQAIAHYGTQKRLADALDVEQSNISKWLKKGAIPYLRQIELQFITKGKLKAEPKCKRPKPEVMCAKPHNSQQIN
jgi:transcriptional regulator with XRE-family HTH domain